MNALTLQALPYPLSWTGEPADVTIGEDRLSLRAGPVTDWFVDPDGSTAIFNAPFLGFVPDGNFQLSARISVDFGGTFDAGVLAVHAGESSWAKLCYEFSPQGKGTVVSVVTRGTSDDCNSFEVLEDSIQLRISRTGRTFVFHASSNGTEWSMIRYFALEGASSAHVGFLTQSPTSEGCTATFERITFRSEWLPDLRDGS